MKAKTTHTINTCAHVQIVHVKKQHNTCTLHVRVPVMCTSHMMCTTVPGTHVKWIFSSFKVFLDENTFIVPYRKKTQQEGTSEQSQKKVSVVVPCIPHHYVDICIFHIYVHMYVYYLTHSLLCMCK